MATPNKQKYIPLIVCLAVAALLLTILVVRLIHKLDGVPKQQNEFGSFYKTLKTKTQSYFN
jgi:uncharacterized protein HemY